MTVKPLDSLETPWYIVRYCEQIEGEEFDLDVCATERNRKAPLYFDESTDGLRKDWHGYVWCNPPYSRGNIAKWVDKVIEQRRNIERCWMLLPAKTDTKWFAKIAEDSQILLLTGRIKFEVDGKPTTGSGMFPSMLVQYPVDYDEQEILVIDHPRKDYTK